MNNNPKQGSRFMGMNTMNNTLNKEDFLNNTNNESNMILEIIIIMKR